MPPAVIPAPHFAADDLLDVSYQSLLARLLGVMAAWAGTRLPEVLLEGLT